MFPEMEVPHLSSSICSRNMFHSKPAMIDAQEHQAIPRPAAVGDFCVALQVLGRAVSSHGKVGKDSHFGPLENGDLSEIDGTGIR